jgi:hypothetical protein
LIEELSLRGAGIVIALGHRLVPFSDGTLEVTDSAGNVLGAEGLITILPRQHYPEKAIQTDALDNALLKYTNAMRLEDHLTFFESYSGAL